MKTQKVFSYVISKSCYSLVSPRSSVSKVIPTVPERC